MICILCNFPLKSSKKRHTYCKCMAKSGKYKSIFTKCIIQIDVRIAFILLSLRYILQVSFDIKDRICLSTQNMAWCISMEDTKVVCMNDITITIQKPGLKRQAGMLYSIVPVASAKNPRAFYSENNEGTRLCYHTNWYSALFRHIWNLDS